MIKTEHNYKYFRFDGDLSDLRTLIEALRKQLDGELTHWDDRFEERVKSLIALFVEDFKQGDFKVGVSTRCRLIIPKISQEILLILGV